MPIPYEDGCCIPAISCPDRTLTYPFGWCIKIINVYPLYKVTKILLFLYNFCIQQHKLLDSIRSHVVDCSVLCIRLVILNIDSDWLTQHRVGSMEGGGSQQDVPWGLLWDTVTWSNWRDEGDRGWGLAWQPSSTHNQWVMGLNNLYEQTCQVVSNHYWLRRQRQTVGSIDMDGQTDIMSYLLKQGHQLHWWPRPILNSINIYSKQASFDIGVNSPN